MQEYYKVLNKNKNIKKLKTIDRFMIINAIYDIFIKGLSVGATTYFSIMIFTEGNGDFSLIGLAVVNILMFLSFGILALSKTYDFYINEHLSAIVEKTNKLKEGLKNEKNMIISNTIHCHNGCANYVKMFTELIQTIRPLSKIML